MCIVKPPKPQAAPPPPNPNMANIAAANQQRMAATQGTGISDNILTRLKDEDVAGSATKKRLGQ